MTVFGADHQQGFPSAIGLGQLTASQDYYQAAKSNWDAVHPQKKIVAMEGL